MYSSISLKNVSLTLYAFHLLKDAETDQREDAHLLWENIAKLSNLLIFSNLKEFPQKLLNDKNEQNLDTPLLQLLPKDSLSQKHLVSYQAGELSIGVYPVRLHDTYTVDFTVFFKEKTILIHELSQLNPQDCLLPQHINASLGQTLLFYAEVENNVEINEKLAKECIKNLVVHNLRGYVIM